MLGPAGRRSDARAQVVSGRASSEPITGRSDDDDARPFACAFGPWSARMDARRHARRPNRRDGLVASAACGQIEQQAHLDDGSSERAYWRYGYLVALPDVRQLLRRIKS